MFSPTLRLVVVAGCIVWSLFDFAMGRPTWYLPLVGAAFLAVGYFRYGTLPLAVRAAKMGDLEKTERLLSKIKHPDRLSGQCRAYFDWLQGVIAANKGDLNSARGFLERALEGKLRTSNDRSLVLGYLAGVCSASGEQDDARGYMATARSLPKKPEADVFLQEISATITSSAENGTADSTH